MVSFATGLWEAIGQKMRGIAQGLHGVVAVQDRPIRAALANVSARWKTMARLCLCIGAVIPVAVSAASAQSTQRSAPHSSAHVYFLTGLIGGIGSSLDPLDVKVRRSGLLTSMSSPGA